jgi:aminoglycoside 6'-N-acetyltransferase
MAEFLPVRARAQTITGRLTHVRRATDEDAELLAAWHADPDVSRYWDDKTFTVQEMRLRLARPDVDPWIIEADGVPVGYIQSWWEEDEPARGGLDGFLLPSARGRGLMPDAAQALARTLLAEGWSEVTVDPYAWNERAIRGWQKAGFVEVSRHPAGDEHTAEWVLMRYVETLERRSPTANVVPE